MYRSTSTRLATMTLGAQLLGAACAVLLATTICEGVIIANMTAKANAAKLEFASADARSAMAHCGAYDVFVTGHDFASADDAHKAALAFVGDGCDYQRGLPHKG
jgi:hypothetical protein